MLAMLTLSSLALANGPTGWRLAPCDELQVNAVDAEVTPVDNVIVSFRDNAPGDISRREHVKITSALATELGIADASDNGTAPQVRVSYGSSHTAAFTVSEITNSNELRLWLYERDGDDDNMNGLERMFGVGAAQINFDGVYVSVHAAAVSQSVLLLNNAPGKAPAYFDEPVSNRSFTECADINRSAEMALLIPHGGNIEVHISEAVPGQPFTPVSSV